MYYVSKAQVKVARNRKYSLGNEYEMTLDALTNITACPDEAGASEVTGIEYNFVKLSNLMAYEKDAEIGISTRSI